MERDRGVLVGDLAERLRYKGDDRQWHPLPGWAGLLLRLGADVAAREPGSPRLVLAISLPTRAFAASLVATGAVARLAERPCGDNLAGHLAYLRSLPPGTVVTHRVDGQRTRKAALHGVTMQGTTDYIVLDEADGRRYIPARNALRVEVARHQPARPPKVTQIRTIRPTVGLAAALGATTADFLTQSRLGVVIIGSDARLRADLEAPLGVEQAHGGLLFGQLQDLVRARQLGKDGEGYRSQLAPFEAAEEPLPPRDAPTIAVFDGGRPFLRAARRWPEANWAIVLDRADPRYDDARAEIDRLYTTRRSPTLVTLALPSPPVGVEYVAFGVEGR